MVAVQVVAEPPATAKALHSPSTHHVEGLFDLAHSYVIRSIPQKLRHSSSLCYAALMLEAISQRAPESRQPGYQARWRTLEQSAGRMPTYKAFLLESVSTGNGFRAHLDNPSHWLPERAELHTHLINTAVAQAQELNKILPPNTIFALRGNTAVGKTGISKKPGRIIEAGLSTTTGIVNPDIYKPELMKREVGGPLRATHAQAHEESTMIARRVIQKLEQQSELSFIVDKRLHGATSIDEMIELAERSGRKLEIIDIDAPLEISLLRILTRRPDEESDPRVPFDAVILAFEGIRRHRARTLRLAQEHPSIACYRLFSVQASGDPELIAEVPRESADRQLIISPDKIKTVEDATQSDTLIETIRSCRNQLLTDDYIDSVVPLFLDRQRTKIQAMLRTYQQQIPGCTLKQALDRHASLLA